MIDSLGFARHAVCVTASQFCVVRGRPPWRSTDMCFLIIHNNDAYQSDQWLVVLLEKCSHLDI